MKTCVYISVGGYLPSQNASALRISNIIAGLNKEHINCYAIGLSDFDEGSIVSIDNYYSIYSIYNKKVKNSNLNKVKTFWFPKKKIKKAIYDIRIKQKIDYIIIYQKLPLSAERWVVKYCKNENIKLLFDIVEYQTLSQQDFFGLFFNYLPNLLTIKKYVKTSSVISISSYLDKMFKERNIPSIYVPAFFDVKNIVPFKKDEVFGLNNISFIYAGMPIGSRDTIVNVIRGFNMLPTHIQEKITFYIAGPTIEQMFKLGLSKKDYTLSKKYCNYLGKLSHDDVIKVYKKCDFSILLKPAKKRFSKAGFPTKVSESFSFGVPVVANLSGDLDLFLKDGVNGFICDSDSPNDFANCILKVFNISSVEYEQLCRNARLTAEKYLSVESYSNLICSFVNNSKGID